MEDWLLKPCEGVAVRGQMLRWDLRIGLPVLSLWTSNNSRCGLPRVAFVGNVANPSRHVLDSDLCHPIATCVGSVIGGAPINLIGVI